MTGAVVVLTGLPGVGKSTTARLVADRLEPSVHLPADDFWRFIRRGAVPPYLPESDEQNRVVIDVLATCAFGYAAGGYQVVVDGIVGPWFADRFRSAAGDLPLHYVVLRADRDTVLARAAGRGAAGLAESGPLAVMYRQFADLGDYEGNVIDTTHLAADQVADTVLGALAGVRHRLT
jgi:predicted kinase